MRGRRTKQDCRCGESTDGVRNGFFGQVINITTDNLSVSTYVEAEDTREKVDIVKLNAEIREIVAREQVLRDEIDKIIAEIEGGKTDGQ